MAIIFVTGANQGLGYALISRLGKETTGNTLLLGARSAEKGQAAVESLAKDGVKAQFVLIDIADDASIEKAAQLIDSEYGKLDVLVNNAAVSVLKKPTVREEMSAVYDINVFSLPVILDAFKPLLVKSDIKKVINISSAIASCQETVQNKLSLTLPLSVIAYTSSKSAVNNITLNYLLNWADDGVKFAVIDPGYVATNLNSYRGTKTPYQGAEAAFFAVTTDDWENGSFLRKEESDDKLMTVPW